MYNEQQKERFIETLNNETTIRLYREWLFEKTEKFEIEQSKDVYDFQYEEILYMYKIMDITSEATLRTIHSMLIQYTKWGVNEGLTKTNQNEYMLIENDIVASCLNKASQELKYISREDFLNDISQLINPRDQFMLLALFEYGKSNRYLDIALQRMEDIDFNNHIMKLNSGRTVKISRQLENYAIRASEENAYYIELNSTIRNYDVEFMTKKLFDNGTIIKSTTADFSSHAKYYRNVYHQIAKSLDRIGLGHCSPGDIIDSGIVSYMKEDMQQTCITDLQEYLLDANTRKRIENQFGMPKIIIKRFVEKYGGLF